LQIIIYVKTKKSISSFVRTHTHTHTHTHTYTHITDQALYTLTSKGVIMTNSGRVRLGYLRQTTTLCRLYWCTEIGWLYQADFIRTATRVGQVTRQPGQRNNASTPSVVGNLAVIIGPVRAS